jgi:hypothetical protein
LQANCLSRGVFYESGKRVCGIGEIC